MTGRSIFRAGTTTRVAKARPGFGVGSGTIDAGGVPAGVALGDADPDGLGAGSDGDGLATASGGSSVSTTSGPVGVPPATVGSA